MGGGGLLLARFLTQLVACFTLAFMGEIFKAYTKMLHSRLSAILCIHVSQKRYFNMPRNARQKINEILALKPHLSG